MYTEYLYEDSLCHYGIKGQKWGNRRFQNLDGSYTALGERRRMEFLARTGHTVSPSSSRTNREMVARSGNTVRINTDTSKRSSSNSGAGKSTVTKYVTSVTNNPSLKKIKSEAESTKPISRIVPSNKKNKLNTISNTSKNSNSFTTNNGKSSESTETTKKKRTKRKSSSGKTRKQKELEKQQLEQQESKNNEQNQGQNEQENSQLTEEQLQDYARRVIRGEFGNGQERKDKLGDKYSQIQALVNSILLKNKRK